MDRSGSGSLSLLWVLDRSSPQASLAKHKKRNGTSWYFPFPKIILHTCTYKKQNESRYFDCSPTLHVLPNGRGGINAFRPLHDSALLLVLFGVVDLIGEVLLRADSFGFKWFDDGLNEVETSKTSITQCTPETPFWKDSSGLPSALPRSSLCRMRWYVGETGVAMVRPGRIVPHVWSTTLSWRIIPFFGTRTPFAAALGT